MMQQKSHNCLTRDISDDVKREVRKRCGFGCVKCGRLFCQYHHFNPEFKDAKEHNANGITLLCPNHHSDCTGGRINNKAIAKYNANPFCLQNKKSHYPLEDLEFPLEVAMGSIVFISENGTLLKIDGEDVLSIASSSNDEPPLFNARLSLGSGEDLIIKENEVVAGVNSWDLDSSASSIFIRRKPRDIALEFYLEPPRRLHFKRVKLNHNGNIIESKYEGCIHLHTPSGATVDFPIGELVLGGQLLMDSREGIKFTNGSRVFGLNKGIKFKMDLNSLFEEVRGMKH